MPKKLIEVALPLIDISDAGAREKAIRRGQINNLHTWWARRPLVAARAVLFAQLVDDPSAHPDRFPTPEAVIAERERLFDVLRGLCEPAGPSGPALAAAKREIRASVGDGIRVADPFAGGGAIPIEAQRLGLDVDSSDLNPVAVLLNRLVIDQLRSAMGRPSVHLDDSRLPSTNAANGLSGLAEDVAWFGDRLLLMAAEEVGCLYPPVIDEKGNHHEVIAWIWARTTPCPNPACGIQMPLVRSFMLSKKNGRECWVDPQTGGPGSPVVFKLRSGLKPRVVSTVGRTGAECVACGAAVDLVRIREDARAGLMGFQLMATAALGERRRVYFPADEAQSTAAAIKAPDDPLGTNLPTQALGFRTQAYGMTTHASLFAPRQLATLTALCEAMPRLREEILEAAGGDAAYADLITTLVGMCISKQANRSCALVPWGVSVECPLHLFTRQAIPMSWDFAEANILGSSAGSWKTTVAATVNALEGAIIGYLRNSKTSVSQANAATRTYPHNVVVSTDPPYFDNIGYADLADFFYVWLRLVLRNVHPDLFATVLTPKVEELVATPYRFGGSQDAANEHFESGFRQVFSQIKQHHHPDIPMTIFYAYKQEDDEGADDGGGSGAGATGWEKLLQGMVDTGLQVTATWPMRTERANRLVARGTNALASSVVLACRPRPTDAGITDRQGFIRHLRREMAAKLVELQSGGVQPVDMAQASIGPGMAVFTSYAKVLEGGDEKMSVGSALQIINQVLDELQTEQEAEFDSDTRWAVTWFDQHGMNSAEFGDAQNIATARGTAVNALERAGIIEARAGRVRLLTRDEYADDWDPTTDKRLTVWEVCQHLIRRVEGDGGLMAAAALLRQVGGLGEAARDLSYRLYEIANRNGWSEEARAYNNLAAEWPDLVALAAQAPSDPSTLF